MAEINLKVQVHCKNKVKYITLPKWFCDLHKIDDDKLIFLEIVVHRIDIVKDSKMISKDLANVYYKDV